MAAAEPPSPEEPAATRPPVPGDPAAPGDGDPAAGGEPSGALLGLVAAGELAAFPRLADVAGDAPDLPDRIELASFAAEAMNHVVRVRDVLAARGRDLVEVMGPFTAPLGAFHAATAGHDRDESLVTTLLGRGLVADLAEVRRERPTPPGPGPALLAEVTPGPAHHEFVRRRITAVTDPRVRARLALAARRRLGEALAAVDAVLDAHPALAAELAGAAGGGRAPLFKHVKRRHGRRVGELGL